MAKRDDIRELLPPLTRIQSISASGILPIRLLCDDNSCP
jgi:hypothetical protein